MKVAHTQVQPRALERKRTSTDPREYCTYLEFEEPVFLNESDIHLSQCEMEEEVLDSLRERLHQRLYGDAIGSLYSGISYTHHLLCGSLQPGTNLHQLQRKLFAAEPISL